ncbi:hypothetical protein F511_27298 [Dorcoceras hygrometricum]|uniref:DUF3741 domain-containing protein n=1 Tax=Dorcoceras hygrometricum TaxID=472368 RepID=A0A2Z7D2A8_9LAMI|nr:hypothetical protein F511_27298 [Dorcoceras hygrometricum]
MGRILRRILCIKSISSRQLEEDDEKESPIMACESASTPGIVARLMGLEPLPFMESIVRSPVLKSFEPFRKPRSPDGRYHRIMIPSYQEVLEDENFFILSFEGVDSPRRFGSGSSRKTQGSGVIKCKKKGTGRVSWQERDEENVGLCVEGINITSSSPDPNLNNDERERKKKVKRDDKLAVIKQESEGNSQNSSPNSVLDFIEAAPSPSSESPSYIRSEILRCNLTAEEISRLKNSRLRRTLCEELENCTKPNEKTLSISKCYGHIRPKSKVRAEKWFETRELAEHEMIHSSWVCNGMSKNRDDYFQEIGKDLSSQVLDQLLLELIVNFSKEFSIHDSIVY